MKSNKENNLVKDFSGQNLTETSEVLLSYLKKNTEVSKIDLSNNKLTKIPIQLTLLPCLTSLDIRNNSFSNLNEVVNTLSKIKALNDLSIDLIDSNEAILVLSSLPNLEFLNGKSTNEDEDGNEENEDELCPYNIEEKKINNKRNFNYNNIDKIEEIGNQESKSNYYSDNSNNMMQYNSNKNNNKISLLMENEDKIGKNEKEKILSNKRKANSNINNLNINNNQISENNKLTFNDNNSQDDGCPNENNCNNKENISTIKSNTSNNITPNNINNINLPKNNLELKNVNSNNNNSFNDLLNDFSTLNHITNNKKDDGNDYVSKYKKMIDTHDSKQNKGKANDEDIYLCNSKIEIINNILNDTLPQITKSVPDLNKNDILKKLLNELFSTIKSKDMLYDNNINLDNSMLKTIQEKNTELTNMNKNLSEKLETYEAKIKNLESNMALLEKQLKDTRQISAKQIEILESENKKMTESLLLKANNIMTSYNNTIVTENNTINNIPLNSQNYDLVNSIRESSSMPKSKNLSINKGTSVTLTENSIRNPKNKSSSISPNSKAPIPIKKKNGVISNSNTITLTNYNVPYNNTNNNNIITLNQLKDFINEIYKSKDKYDQKCIDNNEPKETMEQHMYTFLYKKYGLKSLTLEWAKNIINGIKLYSKKDSDVMLFGKIMRNELEESSRYSFEKVKESVSDLLLLSIKYKNPFKSLDDISKIFEEKKKLNLKEEEWRSIIFYIYGENDGKEIENKVFAYINDKYNEDKEIMITNFESKNNLNNNLTINYHISNNNTININNITNQNKNKLSSLNNSLVSNNNPITQRQNNYFNYSIGKQSKISREEKNYLLAQEKNNEIPYKVFLKIVLDYHIKLKDKQLKNFVELFKKFDIDKNGLLNENEFENMINDSNIFSDLDIKNVVNKFLEVLDPFNYQKISFSDCISFFSTEMIINEKGEKVSLLERICTGPSEINNSNFENNQGDRIKSENDVIKEETF